MMNTKIAPCVSGAFPGFRLLLVASVLLMAGVYAQAKSSVDLEIGSPLKTGDTQFKTGVYTITGSGADIYGTSDQFHFNRGTLSGNGTVVARVTSVSNTNVWAKSGVMLRTDTTPGASNAALLITPGSGLTFQWRSAAGATTGYTQVKGVTAPVWVKLTRQGNAVTGSYSTNGTSWTQIGTAKTIALNATALAGVAVSSHTTNSLCSATFTNIAITPTIDERYLHSEGNEVRNRAGNLVRLRGTNIGGWLVTEGWMCGQLDDGGRGALDQLEARFGAAPAATLINTWRDNWFTDADMDNIQSYGFNLIRVPFSWRNLQDSSGNWIRDTQGNIDFSRFDWVVQEAAKRGIYVIFDLHTWPGGYQEVTAAGEPGATYRTQTVAIWSALATHFKGNGTVAAFDLINEPNGSNDYYVAHRTFYSAIRAQDAERMLVAEWVNVSDFPGLGWTNTLCSGHYPAGTKEGLDAVIADPANHTEYSTMLPCFVGEFKTDDNATAQQTAFDLAVEMNHFGFVWASWTYKAVNYGGWAIFNYDNTGTYNLAVDSYNTILSKWGSVYTQWQNPALPTNYYIKTEMLNGLKAGAMDIPAPLVSGKKYEIRNVNSGRVLDAWGGVEGQTPKQYRELDANNPQDIWLATQQSNGNWTFANQYGRVLDVYGAGTTVDTPVVQWGQNGGSNQEWTLISVGNGTYKLRNAASLLVLEVKGGSRDEGGVVGQGIDVSGASYQGWTFAPIN